MLQFFNLTQTAFKNFCKLQSDLSRGIEALSMSSSSSRRTGYDDPYSSGTAAGYAGDEHQNLFSSSTAYDDPSELVNCVYQRNGCLVKMPRRRKFAHEQKCIYQQRPPPPSGGGGSPPYGGAAEYVPYGSSMNNMSSHIEAVDADHQVECRWAEYGCRVRPKYGRKYEHEEKCNYRKEECSYRGYGCREMVEPSRRFAHERHCPYAT